MNKRIVLPLLCVLPILAAAACKPKSADDENETGTNPTEPGEAKATENPIEGIEPAKKLFESGAFTDGPIWNEREKVWNFTAPLGEGGLYKVDEAGSAAKVRDGAKDSVPIGNTVEKTGAIVTVETKRLVRGNAPIATGYAKGAQTAPFDTLNDAVAHASGNIYVTDPGYMGEPIANRLYRLDGTGKVSVVAEFQDVPRPNGVAFSPDQKTLYVGFERPVQGTKPYIEKWAINADGTPGNHEKFVDLDMDSSPDGIEVDKDGNVYVATKAGIAVFRANAEKLGVISVPEQPTAMAFGGADMKTLLVTTHGINVFTVKVKVAGIAQ